MDDFQTLLPQAFQAERGLLSAFAQDPVNVGGLCAERGIGISHFHVPHHATIFTVLMEHWIAGKPLDYIILSQHLEKLGQLESCGGGPAISELWWLSPSSTFAPGYIVELEEMRILRALISTGKKYASRAQEEQDDAHGLLEEASAAFCAIASPIATTEKPKTPKEMAIEAMDRAQERIEKRGLSDFTMRTGLKQIDEAMSGIRLGDFVLVSGKEKSGKTSLAFNIFEHVVFSQEKRGWAASLEMKLPEITDRMISSIGKINFTNVLNGWMSDSEQAKFTETAGKLAGGKFQIRDDLFGLSQIIAALRQYKAAYPDLELGIVDYLQLVDGDKVGKDDSREQIIARTSRTLRRAAGELNIAIILLVQLNEDGQVRESRAPGMDCTAHIRIEPGKTESEKWARIVYQRNGPSNVGIPLHHMGMYLRFEQGAPREEDPEPTQKRDWKKRHQ